MISNFSEASIIVLLWTVRSSMAFENLLVNCWMFIIVLIGVYKDGLHRFFCVFFFTRHQILAKYKLFFYTAWLVRTRWRFIIPHFLYSPSLILFSFWFSFQLSFYSSPPPPPFSFLPSLSLFDYLVAHTWPADIILSPTCLTGDNMHFCLSPAKARFLQHSPLHLLMA